MSPLIRKEIRLLLPYWAIAMLLAIIPPLALARDPHDPLDASFFWAFGFGMVLLGLAPFGHEFNGGTFSSLLVHPMDRRRIWRLKILLTGLAALLVLVAFESVLYWRTSLHLKDVMLELSTKFSPLDARLSELQSNERKMNWAGLRHTGSSIILVLLVAISGGFWTTLLFRQTGAALWFVILIPGALWVALEASIHLLSTETQRLIITVTFALYSVAGFMWARRMFTHAQDYQWLGESIAVFNLKSTKVRDDSAAPRRKAAILALVRKEIQSHQISLLIAFGLLVLHICALIFRRLYDLPKNSEFRFAVESMPFLWLLVPWLVGAVAIAEERKLGTMESQLCLPSLRRTQFTVKLVVALVLGLVLGGIVPCAIEWLGLKLHVGSQMLGLAPVAHSNEVIARTDSSIHGMGAFVAICMGAGLISLVSFFASSLTRNTLHALGTAVAFGFAWIAFFGAVVSHISRYNGSLWTGPLILFVGIPAAIIATIALSFSNYKMLHAGRNVWLRNAAVLFITLVFASVATAVIYQRPWELVISVEPRPGPAVLSGSVQPTIVVPQGKIFALLPDGRIWTATGYQRKELGVYYQTWNPNTQTDVGVQVEAEIPTSGSFLTGSNWTGLAGNQLGPYIAGLRSDGTLWEFDVRNSNPEHRLSNWLSGTPEPRRVGSDSDWKAVAAGQNCFYAIKTNGTLWGWGDNSAGRVASIPRPYFNVPIQIGTNSDWARFFPQNQDTLFMKTNGDVWGWAQYSQNRQLSARFGSTGMNGADWLSVGGDSYMHDAMLIVRRDGTLWTRPSFETQRFFGNGIGGHNEEVRVGNRSDWRQIVGTQPNLYGLKKDGRLVRNQNELFSSFLGRFSKRSDWLAANAQWNQMFALAADGTLCEWFDPRGWGTDASVLAPTRRPLWTMNILTDVKH